MKIKRTITQQQFPEMTGFWLEFVKVKKEKGNGIWLYFDNKGILEKKVEY